MVLCTGQQFHQRRDNGPTWAPCTSKKWQAKTNPSAGQLWPPARPDQLNTGHLQSTVPDNPRGRDNQRHDEFAPRVMHAPPVLRRTSVSLTEAAADSPMLAHLGALVERSKQHMVAIESILPKGLKAQVTAGPVEEGVWCLLVRSGAVASKLRQLLPDLEARLLAVQGSNIKIRIKILAA